MKTDYPGVRWIPSIRKYIATIYAESQRVHLGCFAEKEKAIKAHRLAESAYRKARPNGRLRKDNASGVPGIHFDNKLQKWVVRLKGKRVGTFPTLDKAKSAHHQYTLKNK